MDRTVTRRATYAAFLLHAALRLAPWRLLLLPLSASFTLGYALRLIDRGRLKELNYTLLVGRGVAPERLAAGGRELRRAQLTTNILPQARAAIDADRRPAAASSSPQPPTSSTPRRSARRSASTTSSPPAP